MCTSLLIHESSAAKVTTTSVQVGQHTADALVTMSTGTESTDADIVAEPSVAAEEHGRALPPKTCTHKQGRCAVCLACKVCGCDHDGVAVSVKVNRKRGRPRKPAKSSTPIRSSPNGPATAQQTTRSTPRRAATLANVKRYCAAEPDDWDDDDDDDGRARYVKASMQNIASLGRLFGVNISGMTPKAFPTAEISPEQAQRVITFVQSCTKKLAEELYPRNPSALLTAVAEGITGHQAIVDNKKKGQDAFLRCAVEALKGTKRGSVERRVVRAQLSKGFTLNTLRSLMPTLDFTLSQESHQIGRADYDRLVSGASLAPEKAKEAGE
jgi:hypothetical protein